MHDTPRPRTIRFDAFEVDRRTGEIRKNGVRVKLADQPFRVLMALLDRPGDLVPRDELRQLLWNDEVAGDFEQGLNRAVNRVRNVLRDSATSPRYIETLPGRGYRFVGQVEPEPIPPPPPPARRQLWKFAAAGLFLVLLGTVVWQSWPPRVPTLHARKLTTDNYTKIPPALSDGSRIYFLASRGGEEFIAQLPARGGDPARLPITLPGPSSVLQDLSPDGQEILLTAGASGERRPALPLWTLQIGDGTARRVGSVLATSAAYSPDGSRIAFTTDSALWVEPKRGSPHRLVELKDSILSEVSWKPGGREIRFARLNPMTADVSAWEIGDDGTKLRQILPGWQGTNHVPEGWTPDARLELFAAGGGFWITAPGGMRFSAGAPAPLKATDDEAQFLDKVRLRSSVSFPAIGIDRLGELQRYEAATKRWLPLLDGISAETAEFSRDGRRVTYISYPQGTLWVREADGKRPIQLTSPPAVASYPHWSPDGRQVLFNGQDQPGRPTKIYLVDAEGGAIHAAAPKDGGSQGAPTWSPDGTKVLYGLNGRSARETVYVRSLDLASGKVDKFPGSDGLFGPRWSPDGKMIMALEWEGQRRLMLYRFETQNWTPITSDRADSPAWTADSRSVVYRSGEAVVRLRVDRAGVEKMAVIDDAESGGFYHAIGTTPDGSPTRTLNRDSRQIYELLFQTK